MRIIQPKDEGIVEEWIQTSIANAADFLFDANLFDQELDRIWQQYGIHPHVSSKHSAHAHLDKLREIKTQKLHFVLTLLSSNVP